MQRLRHPLIVLTLVACGVVMLGLALSPRWAARKLADGLLQQIRIADEQGAVALVAQLARLDDAALRPLVELLDDHRQTVRSAAREAIRQKLADWSDQRTPASERSVALLAREMATYDGPRDLHSRVFVKLTALKLLRLPLESSDLDRPQFLADCSMVLERNLSARAGEAEVARKPRRLLDSPNVFEIPAIELASEPVAELPSVPAAGDSAPALLSPDEEQPLPPARLESDSPRRIRSAEIDSPCNSVDDDALRSLSTRALIRHLQGLPVIAGSVEGELRRRGLDDATLKLARALDDPDPAVRLQLAESLPKLAGIDPAPWLWELAEDENENVRRTARNILATSNNPRTRARVGRLK